MIPKIKIAGAGISGLSASIFLAMENFHVQVYEARPTIGSFFSNDIHSLRNYLYDEDILSQYNEFGLSISPAYPIYNQIRFAPNLKKIKIYSNHEPLFYNFFRGNVNVNSLDRHLYSLALSKKVKFYFNSPIKNNDADIIATGSPKTMVSGYGWHYQNVKNLEPHTNYIFWDNNYAPGGYIYIVPYGDEASVAIVAFNKKETLNLEKKFNALIKNHTIIKNLLDGAKPKNMISGFACYGDSALLRKNNLKIGEAGGFLDAATGFGVHYAILSGYMAAKIIAKKDVCVLKKKVSAELKKQYAKRIRIEKMNNNDYNNIINDLSHKFRGGIPAEEYRAIHENK